MGGCIVRWHCLQCTHTHRAVIYGHLLSCIQRKGDDKHVAARMCFDCDCFRQLSRVGCGEAVQLAGRVCCGGDLWLGVACNVEADM